MDLYVLETMILSNQAVSEQQFPMNQRWKELSNALKFWRQVNTIRRLDASWHLISSRKSFCLSLPPSDYHRLTLLVALFSLRPERSHTYGPAFRASRTACNNAVQLSTTTYLNAPLMSSHNPLRDSP